MPIYEYRCQDCGTKFEKLVRRSADASENACPQCGKNHLEQEYSTFAAHAGGSPKVAEGRTCPSGGMCSNPGGCGMNFN